MNNLVIVRAPLFVEINKETTKINYINTSIKKDLHEFA